MVGLKSHHDDEFIDSIWSFVLGTPSRLLFDIKPNECDVGLCSIELPEASTTEMNTNEFCGKWPTHKVKDEHIIGLRLCTLFRTVEANIYEKCKENEIKRLKKQKRKLKKTKRSLKSKE